MNPPVEPLWSVMIPTYRPNENFLSEALASVLRQAPEPEAMQIEVVDDGSPDVDVAALVARVGGDRVRVERNPRNLGLAGCWNACWNRAQGRLIHILHQDDLVQPGFYAAIGAGFERHPEIGAAFSRHAFIESSGRWHSVSAEERPTPGLLPDWLARIAATDRIQCSSIVVPRSVYRQIGGYRTDLQHVLDWEMWVRIARRYPVYYEPQTLACFRQHAGSMTSRQERSGVALAETFRALRDFSAELRPADVRAARRQHALRGLCLARREARTGEGRAAWRNLRVILANCRDRIVVHQALRIVARLGLAWLRVPPPRPSAP